MVDIMENIVLTVAFAFMELISSQRDMQNTMPQQIVKNNKNHNNMKKY